MLRGTTHSSNQKFKEYREQSIVAHGGESPTHKANARRQVVHASVECKNTGSNWLKTTQIGSLLASRLGCTECLEKPQRGETSVELKAKIGSKGA